MEPSPALKAIIDAEATPQVQSPIFRLLPPEIRTYIWSLAVATHSSMEAADRYNPDTSYIRPDYTGQPRTHTDLLRTCRAVLRESWSLVAANFELLEWVGLRPSKPLWAARVHDQRHLDGARSEALTSRNIHSLRLFIRAILPDPSRYYHVPHLLRHQYAPETITVTVRYVDWLRWQIDEPLQLSGRWVPYLGGCLTERTREMRIELETSERKANQVRQLAAQMMGCWHFRRCDGKRLFADRVEESRWKGTSVWNERRWTREETAPGEMHHVNVSVRFRLEDDMDARTRARIGRVARIMADKDEVCECKLRLRLSGVVASESTETSLRWDKGFPIPYPSWVQPPRVIMEAGDGEYQEMTDLEEGLDDCQCTRPRMQLQPSVVDDETHEEHPA